VPSPWDYWRTAYTVVVIPIPSASHTESPAEVRPPANAAAGLNSDGSRRENAVVGMRDAHSTFRTTNP